MLLNYSKRGRQFFFVTMTVAGRRQILSRIAPDGSVALTAVGEVVKAALIAVHRVWPTATLSDFVIMPDHIHYLLMVNFDSGLKPPTPLFIAHRLADAIEAALEWTGAAAPEPPKAAPTADSMAELLRKATTRAHAAYVAQRSGDALQQGFGGGATVHSIFNRDIYIELSFDARQLKAVRRYIKLNPARARWKALHPDRPAPPRCCDGG